MSARQVFHFMLASGASTALRFLAFPLLAALLSTEEFGRASLFLASLPFLALAMSWNLAVPWVVEYHGVPEDDNRRRMGAALSVLALSGALLAGVAWFLHPWIEARMDFGVGRMGYLQMIACSVLSSVSLLHLELDKIRQETGRYLAASLLQTALQLGMAVGWVLVRGASFPSFLAGHTAGCVLIALYQSFARAGGCSPLFPRRHDILHLWTRALPIALSSAFALVASLGDRYFVRAATGYADVALYTMSAKIGEIVQQTLQTPFLAALAPVLLALAHGDPARLVDRFRTDMRRFLGLALLSTTALGALLDPLYALLLPPAYAPGIPISILFLWGFAIGGMGQAWATTLLAQGRLMSVTRLTATAALASLVLNALLTPRWHALGAAIAAVCVQAITWAQSWALTSREFRHCLDGRARALVAGILVLPVLQLVAALGIPGSFASTAARIAVWLVAVGILHYTGLLGELRGFVRERLRTLPWAAPKSNGSNELR